MTFEQDTIIDFIEWLEERNIYLIDITNNKDRFVTTGSFPSDFTELEELLEVWGNDVEEWDK